MRTVKTVERFSDTIVETTIEIETRPAVVDYRDILEACEVVPDDLHGAPWDECDGWEHTSTRLLDMDDPDSSNYDAHARRGYAIEMRSPVIIELEVDFGDDYRHYRKCGMSKQSASEMVALAKRSRLDTIVKWYENGYEWYGVKGEHLDREDSLWGIDGYDYAYDHARHDIANEIADQLEDDGYAITNRPDPVKLGRQAKRDRLKRNLKLDCWTD